MAEPIGDDKTKPHIRDTPASVEELVTVMKRSKNLEHLGRKMAELSDQSDHGMSMGIDYYIRESIAIQKEINAMIRRLKRHGVKGAS